MIAPVQSESSRGCSVARFSSWAAPSGDAQGQRTVPPVLETVIAGDCISLTWCFENPNLLSPLFSEGHVFFDRLYSLDNLCGGLCTQQAW